MADVEYITTPGPGLLPGSDNLPGWDNKAPDTTIVHAHDGGAWEEITDEETKRIARAASKQAGTIRTVVSSIGGVSYFYKGDYDPPMRGNGPGDAAFALDDNDNVIRLYRWTGTAWVRHELDNAVIANLDVGKLTAGSASISNVVAKHIWSGIVTSKAVEAEQITGDMIAANSFTATSGHIQSLDAGVITAGLLDADRIAGRSITAAHLQLGTITGESGILKNLNASDITAGVLSADRIDASTLRGKLIEGAVIRGGYIEGGMLTAVNQQYPESKVQISDRGMNFILWGSTYMSIGRGSRGFVMPRVPDEGVEGPSGSVFCYNALYGMHRLLRSREKVVWDQTRGYVKVFALNNGGLLSEYAPGVYFINASVYRGQPNDTKNDCTLSFYPVDFDNPSFEKQPGYINIPAGVKSVTATCLFEGPAHFGKGKTLGLAMCRLENGQAQNKNKSMYAGLHYVGWLACNGF